MIKCKQFTDIYNEVINLGGTHNELGYDYPLSTGKILGYDFRMFQQHEKWDEHGPSKNYIAYISIDDEKSKDNIWTTFYSPTELKDWYEQHKH